MGGCCPYTPDGHSSPPLAARFSGFFLKTDSPYCALRINMVYFSKPARAGNLLKGAALRMDHLMYILETRKPAVPSGNGGFAPGRSAPVGR